MDLNAELEKYSKYVSLPELQEAVRLPMLVCDESPKAVLPSMEMRADGPGLAGLFLVTENYLSEVRLGPRQPNFDFVTLKSIRDYRVEFSREVVSPSQGAAVTHELATVRFLHSGIPGYASFESKIFHFGTDREEWVRSIFAAIPLSCMLR